MKVFSLGMDPEFMGYCTSKGPMHFCDAGLPGTKEEPSPIGDGFAIQLDGAALELTTPVVNTPEQFVEMRNEARNRAMEITHKYLGEEIRLCTQDSAQWKDDEFSQYPDSLVVGCDADENAYRDYPNMVPGADFLNYKRIMGGHIHIAHTDMLPSEAVAKLADLCISIPRGIAGDSRYSVRFDFQGNAGTFRRKFYGTEYRTPGTSIMFTPDDMLLRCLTNMYNMLEWIEKYPDESLKWFLSVNWSADSMRYAIGYGGADYGAQYAHNFYKGLPKQMEFWSGKDYKWPKQDDNIRCSFWPASKNDEEAARELRIAGWKQELVSNECEYLLHDGITELQLLEAVYGNVRSLNREEMDLKKELQKKADKKSKKKSKATKRVHVALDIEVDAYARRAEHPPEELFVDEELAGEGEA